MTASIAGPSAASASAKPTVAGATAPRAPSVPFRSLLLGRAAKPLTPQPSSLTPGRAATATPARRAGCGASATRPSEDADRSRPRRGHGDACEEAQEKLPRPAHPDDALDPAARQAAHLAPLPAPGAAGALAAAATAPDIHARASLEQLLPALVKRIAWAGDGRRGSVRMELGAGALAGGTVLVHADGGRVRIEIEAPAGADREAWKKRIIDRLTGSGLDVEHVEVT